VSEGEIDQFTFTVIADDMSEFADMMTRTSTVVVSAQATLS